MDNKNKALKTAFLNYCKIIEKPIEKLKNLDNWMLKLSKYFLKENFLADVKSEKIYKRGSLIYVDFGINIGSELSGAHFAIVLNKNDNSRANKITVIPLTSKNKGNEYNIGNQVFASASEILTNKIKIIDSILENGDKLQEQEFEKDREHTIKYLKSLIDLTTDAKKTRGFIYPKRDFNEKEIDKLIGEVVNNYINAINKWNKRFKKYDKDSYILIDNITSVSKSRIIIDRCFIDFSTSLKVKDHVLNLIDAKILKHLTNLDIEKQLK